MEITNVIIVTLLVILITICLAILIIIISKNRRKSGPIDDDATNIVDIVDDLRNMLNSEMKNNTTLILSNTKTAIDTLMSSQTNTLATLTNIVNTLVKDEKTNSDTFLRQLNKDIQELQSKITNELKTSREDSEKLNKDFRDTLNNRMQELIKDINTNLDKLRENNQQKLDEMRNTVEEKLNKTLNDRISQSFETVNNQLLKVEKGLGEMGNLTTKVSDLNKVLNGVKDRGTWGEVALDNLLEQILSPQQYGRQVNIKQKNAVDFAVFLPSKESENEILYLPIDAKFPLADYERLSTATEEGNINDIRIARTNLNTIIKNQAKDIASKYIDPPKTTNFAIMYLPIEGLYAEVARQSELMAELHTKHSIMIAGPTTLTALLTSLQVGFQTLTIQKSSNEIFKSLQTFKKDITNLVSLLEKTQKNANTISKDMESSLKRVGLIDKRITKIESLGDDTVPALEDIDEVANVE